MLVPESQEMGILFGTGVVDALLNEMRCLVFREVFLLRKQEQAYRLIDNKAAESLALSLQCHLIRLYGESPQKRKVIKTEGVNRIEYFYYCTGEKAVLSDRSSKYAPFPDATIELRDSHVIISFPTELMKDTKDELSKCISVLKSEIDAANEKIIKYNQELPAYIRSEADRRVNGHFD